MEASLDPNSTYISDLLSSGLALHWLHPKEKRPVGDDWSTKPVATLEQLRRRHVSGNNVGVRLGEPSKLNSGSYGHLIDVDIRNSDRAEEAMAALDEMLPGLADSVPSVISGSGGQSRHYWFTSSKPFRSRKLAHSKTFKMVYDPKKGREVKKWDWEIELFGTGKQAAIPPSIHPDTGLPYRWERPLDFVELELGLYDVPAATLEELGVLDQASVDESLDLKPAMGYAEDDARDILDTLLKHASAEYLEDHDGWLKVGMALHHEFGGNDTGWELWKEFSERSEKFDERKERIRWNSFRDKPNAVRMASLVQAAMQMQSLEFAMSSFEDIDDEPEADDDSGLDDNLEALIGTPSERPGNDFKSLLSSGAIEGLGWISMMDVNKDGNYRPTLRNVQLVVCNDPRWKHLARYNMFLQDIVQLGEPGHKVPRRKNQPKPVLQLNGPIWEVDDPVNGTRWSDARDASLRNVIEAPGTQGGYGFQVSDRNLKDAILIAANQNRFHPVRDYFEAVAWDGKPRLERMFVEYLGAEENAYTFSVGRLMMTAAVTRIYEPGHKFDFAVILEGLQGRRKSTFIRILGRKWYGEINGDFHNPKNMIELMQNKLILELPELSGFVRSDVRAIKAFISCQSDRARLAYARRAGEYPRQCIFIGSTNDREYLKDDTGGRRFWPMLCRVASIDTDKLEREVDQLWAEALVTYREMRKQLPKGDLPLYLTDPEAQRIAAELQESRRVTSADDDMAGIIDAWLAAPINDGGIGDEDFAIDAAPRYRDRVCLPEIWVKCFGGDLKVYLQAQQLQNQLGRAMKKFRVGMASALGNSGSSDRSVPLSAPCQSWRTKLTS